MILIYRTILLTLTKTAPTGVSPLFKQMGCNPCYYNVRIRDSYRNIATQRIGYLYFIVPNLAGFDVT
ncbi:hypothetical protein GcC1_c112o32 [Golovinomyces cichoracearum]|uniref:Uncharacterized protein n=1 Tax=Golovinomyces cichoracearum TaxID=62708 RepID=A0A420J7T3_9PEZI|nr:hypothetical protein GcC1_c112o32 [Golovinomyces cichoracearum]